MIREAHRISEQQRIVNPGLTETIYLYKVPPRMFFILQDFFFQKLSEQGEQDLIVTLKADKKIIARSGKYQTTQPEYPSESRVSNTSGLLYSEISSSDGSGTPDNFSMLNKNIYIALEGNTLLTVDVKNQSAVYKHGIIVGGSGMLVRK